MWLDSHCHVNADAFAADRAEVLDRAQAAGVERMVAIGSGYGLRGNEAAVALALSDARVFATAGVHPHEASDFEAIGLERLRAWLAEERVVAVGECGLDYHYMNSPREAQRAAFAAQVGLARELDLPVSIHVRGDEPNAYEEMIDIWKSEGGGQTSGVLHCYTGELEFARRGIDANLWVSFSGIVTFKRSDGLRRVASGLPLGRLLVETDAPFLAPQGHRGRRNEPAWVGVVGETLATLHGVGTDEVAHATRRNAREFYRLDRIDPPAAGEAGASG